MGAGLARPEPRWDSCDLIQHRRRTLSRLGPPSLATLSAKLSRGLGRGGQTKAGLLANTDEEGVSPGEHGETSPIRLGCFVSHYLKVKT